MGSVAPLMFENVDRDIRFPRYSKMESSLKVAAEVPTISTQPARRRSGKNATTEKQHTPSTAPCKDELLDWRPPYPAHRCLVSPRTLAALHSSSALFIGDAVFLRNGENENAAGVCLQLWVDKDTPNNKIRLPRDARHTLNVNENDSIMLRSVHPEHKEADNQNTDCSLIPVAATVKITPLCSENDNFNTAAHCAAVSATVESAVKKRLRTPLRFP